MPAWTGQHRLQRGGWLDPCMSMTPSSALRCAIQVAQHVPAWSWALPPWCLLMALAAMGSANPYRKRARIWKCLGILALQQASPDPECPARHLRAHPTISPAALARFGNRVGPAPSILHRFARRKSQTLSLSTLDKGRGAAERSPHLYESYQRKTSVTSVTERDRGSPRARAPLLLCPPGIFSLHTYV